MIKEPKLIRSKDLRKVTDDQLMEFLSSDYWIINKNLVKRLGITTTIWLSHIIYKYKYFKNNNMLDEENYFYNVQSYIEEETTLSPAQQTNIIKQLADLKILQVKRKGLPARNYYKINIRQMIRTCSQEIKELDAGKKRYKISKKEDLISKKDSVSSLRKEDTEGNPEISHQAIGSANPSTRPSLETATTEVPAKSSRPARDDSILPRKKVPVKQLEYEHASDEARSLVEDWNELPTTPVHKNGSQAVRKVLHLLDEKLLKEYGSKGIFKAMLDFSNMQKNAGDYRVPTGKVSIDDFFIGNGYLNGVKERRGETVEPAWFQKLILPGSFVKYLRREDPNPEVTEELRYRYRKHVLADQGVSFGPRQESQFREASKRLREFMRRGRLEKFLDNVGYKDYVRFLLDALIGKYKKVTEIEVGHLCSNYTWNDLFPKFIAYNWEE